MEEEKKCDSEISNPRILNGLGARGLLKIGIEENGIVYGSGLIWQWRTDTQRF